MTATLWHAGPHAAIYDRTQVSSIGAEMFSPEHWRSAGCLTREAKGRGAAWFINQGSGWVLRHYRRGGLIGRVIADRYLWTGEEQTRAFREWRLLHTLHAQELPVPRPVAAHVERQGLFYRADLITEAIADTETLAQRLAREAMPDEAWQRLGRFLTRFSTAGVVHADLNAHNVLCRSDGEFFLIDFDRGRLTTDRAQTHRGVRRLKQSLDKLARLSTGFHFSPAHWQTLISAYGTAR